MARLVLIIFCLAFLGTQAKSRADDRGNRLNPVTAQRENVHQKDRPSLSEIIGKVFSETCEPGYTTDPPIVVSDAESPKEGEELLTIDGSQDARSAQSYLPKYSIVRVLNDDEVRGVTNLPEEVYVPVRVMQLGAGKKPKRVRLPTARIHERGFVKHKYLSRPNSGMMRDIESNAGAIESEKDFIFEINAAAPFYEYVDTGPVRAGHYLRLATETEHGVTFYKTKRCCVLGLQCRELYLFQVYDKKTLSPTADELVAFDPDAACSIVSVLNPGRLEDLQTIHRVLEKGWQRPQAPPRIARRTRLPTPRAPRAVPELRSPAEKPATPKPEAPPKAEVPEKPKAPEKPPHPPTAPKEPKVPPAPRVKITPPPPNPNDFEERKTAHLQPKLGVKMDAYLKPAGNQLTSQRTPARYVHQYEPLQAIKLGAQEYSNIKYSFLQGPFNTLHYYKKFMPRTYRSAGDKTAVCAMLNFFQAWDARCKGAPDCRLYFGDIFSPLHDGEHRSHANGRCVDIVPLRTEGAHFEGTQSFKGIGRGANKHYDWQKTKAMIDLAREYGAKDVIFCDPQVEPKHRGCDDGRIRGHTDHVHMCFTNTRLIPKACQSGDGT